MVGILCRPQGKHRSMMQAIMRGFWRHGRVKGHQAGGNKLLNSNNQSQSFELGSFRPGRHRVSLVVFTPRRLTLFAGTKITGAQTLPSNRDAL
jgi:hypothetical protein